MLGGEVAVSSEPVLISHELADALYASSTATFTALNSAWLAEKLETLTTILSVALAGHKRSSNVGYTVAPAKARAA